MITFSIDPYVGALPIRFGATPQEVELLLGPCLSVLPSPFGDLIEQREHLSFSYSNSQLTEAVFAPGASLTFYGKELLSHPDPIDFLRKFDDSPFLWVGFIIFLKLGISVSGFHDGDDSQKAIAVVKRGYFDEYVKDFKLYK